MKIAFLHPIEFEELIDKVEIDPIKMTELFGEYDLEFEGQTFEITQGVWPSIDEFDAFVITGSPNSAYQELPWILQLEKLIQEIYASGKKLLGICFGHQMIAKALGGEVKDANEWLLGLHDIKVSVQKPWMQPFKEDASLYFINHDQVSQLPDEAEVLAHNASCPQGMFCVGNQVFCVQAHPEQSEDFLKVVIDSLEGHLDEGVLGEARASLTHPADQALMFKWMVKFLQN